MDATPESRRPLPAFLDSELLTVEDVSRLLRCAPDTVRRIPRDRLPVYRPGRRNLYLREDLIRYVRSCRVEPPAALDALLTEIAPGVVNSQPDGVQGRARRRSR